MEIRSREFHQLSIPPAAAGGLFNPSLPKTENIPAIPPAAAGGLFIPSLCFPPLKPAAWD